MHDLDRIHHLRRALYAVAMALALAAQGPAQVPTLDHGPPFIGSTLDLVVDGAPPGAKVTYLHSPNAGSLSTPYGTLELERSSAARIGSLHVDANGHGVLQIALPLDPALVQTEAHYQALVEDPSAPANAVLTGSVSLRFLGPRVYVGTRGRSAGPNGPLTGALEMIDASSDTLVGRIDYSGPVPAGEGRAEPVFSANYARGAVMASPSELVLFDPFFGATIGVLACDGASRTLLASPDGSRAHVLETSVGGGARIRSVDLAQGQVVAEVVLPVETTSLWCLDEVSNTAFVTELSMVGETRVRTVDLDSGTFSGATIVGGAGSTIFRDLLVADGQLFAATRTTDVGTDFEGRLSRTTLPLASSTIQTTAFYRQEVNQLAPVAALNLLLAFFMDPIIPHGALRKTRLSGSASWPGCGLPWVYLHVDGLAVDGTSVWVIDSAGNEPPGGGEPGQLYELKPRTNTWTTYPRSWPFEGPTSVVVLADGLVHKVYVTAPGQDSPINIAPELLSIDLSNSAEASVTIGWAPESLRVIPLP